MSTTPINFMIGRVDKILSSYLVYSFLNVILYKFTKNKNIILHIFKMTAIEMAHSDTASN